MREPDDKRLHVFIDGQNLFHAVKAAFGYSFPCYDPAALAQWVARERQWHLEGTHFYTGLPSDQDDPFWHHFWARKLAVMGTRGVHCFSRPLKYRNQTVRLPGGNTTTILVGQEKGIDVRLALDVVRMAHQGTFDVAAIFSQDQDLSEVADEVRRIARDQNRWIKLVSVFPTSPTFGNRRGINKTDWLPIDRATFDLCLDPNDYRDHPTV